MNRSWRASTDWSSETGRIFEISHLHAGRFVNDDVVRPEGLEPPTLWSEARCSIR